MSEFWGMYLICVEEPNWSERFLYKNKQNAINFLPELIADVDGDMSPEDMEYTVQAVLKGDHQSIWLEELEVQDA